MKHKNILAAIVLLFCSSNIIIAQQLNKYEVFFVNNKTGIVDIATLKEIQAPIINNNSSIGFSNKYFLLMQGKDSVKPFNKQTGIWEKSLAVVGSQPFVQLNGKMYSHVFANKKSALYDENIRLKFSLPQSYNSFFSIHSNIPDNFMIAEVGDTAHVLALKGNQFILLHQLEATSFSNEVLVQKDGTEQNVHVLFGGSNTYIFNRKFELIRTINSKVSSNLYLDRLLNPELRREGSPNGPDNITENVLDGSYQQSDKEDSLKYYTSKQGKIRIGVDKNCTLQGQEREMIWVSKIIYKKQAEDSTVSYGTTSNYGFLLDRTGRKALIPEKYQKEISLKILYK